jgi:hypothetical protein
MRKVNKNSTSYKIGYKAGEIISVGIVAAIVIIVFILLAAAIVAFAGWVF